MESRTAVYLKGNVSVIVVAYLSLLILIGMNPTIADRHNRSVMRYVPK